MKHLQITTLIFLCNLAIPANDVIQVGLGDLLKVSDSKLLNNLIDEFINDHSVILDSIYKFTSINQVISLSSITDHLKTIVSSELRSSFLRDLSSFCSKAYFTHPVVLSSYSLVYSEQQVAQILDPTLDKPIFDSLSPS